MDKEAVGRLHREYHSVLDTGADQCGGEICSGDELELWVPLTRLHITPSCINVHLTTVY